MTLVAGEVQVETAAGGVRVPLTLVALVAAILLAYSSGSFLIAEVLGIKRYVQVFLVFSLIAGAVHVGLHFRLRSINPLMGFVFAMLVTELALRRQTLYVFDALAALLALLVISSAPRETFWIGARVLVWLATLFASMALLQWVLLFNSPELGAFRLFVTDAGTIENSVKHPAMYLGLFREQIFNLFGRPIARMQSFTMEPSLNVVYFMLPACLAILMNRRLYFGLALVILAFCLLSFSGSVLLSCAFSALWLVMLTFVPLRFAFSYGTLLLLAGYLFAIQRVGYDAIIAGIAVLAQYGDFLAKNASVTVRGLAATENLATAIAQPFGSTNVSDMAGPWPINAALAAGWAGPILIFFFLRSLGRRAERLNSGYNFTSRTRIGTLVLLGALSTIVAFNDYQMTAYAGIVLVAFISRAIDLRLESEDAASSRQ
ncbi:MAG TPA: hypothetical protein VFS58_09145 [Steroidobacteraceae bacterium]|nr:hypothetical protein [Steroidobacteraceae bacterium]